MSLPDTPGSGANGPAMAADLGSEVLLLLRVAMTDNEPGERERAVLYRVAQRLQHDTSEEVDELVAAACSFGAEIGPIPTRLLLQSAGTVRGLALAHLVGEIAASDVDLAPRRARLMARVADILDINPDDLVMPTPQ
ncbi:TerB family tellurite resistance protein [Nitratireductor indicus]|nr:TerB family tellurite resistance protein [Nitratireductor indicus]SFQ39755.1 Uncharacterized conserved protein, tellurite resistance protein B (TerB) family [Nitratireductor indicus]